MSAAPTESQELFGALANLSVPTGALHLRALAIHHTRQAERDPSPDNRILAMDSVSRLAAALGAIKQ